MGPVQRVCAGLASYAEFDLRGWPAGIHRGMPAGALVVVICLEGPPVLRRAGHADVQASATVGGLRSSVIDIVHDGTQRGVQIDLTPRGARALLGVPAAALAEGVWPLSDVVGRKADELTARLSEAGGPAARALVLDAVLASWRTQTSYPAAVDAAWRRLTRSAGSTSVSAIAREAGLSRRHLSGLVRAELGLGPKTVARVLRFARARSCLRSGQTTTLAETAASCGYFDQAHMASDWRQLGGCTPGEWVSEELPFLQDSDAGGSRF